MKMVSKGTNHPLMSVSEAAALAGLSKSVAYRLAQSGTLPGLVRLPGARMLVRRRVLEAWLSGADAEQDEPGAMTARTTQTHASGVRMDGTGR